MKTITINKIKVHVFRSTNGWHWCFAGNDYLDERGRVYPSQAKAERAARECIKWNLT